MNTQIVNPNPLPDGSTLADYVVTGIVGEGGFGIVYSARDEQLGRTIAIKEYLPSSIAGRTGDLSVRVRSTDSVETFRRGLQRFMGEAKLLAQCSHPALLEVYRVWEQNETAYIAMRLCHGQTAREARATMNGGMSESDIRQLLMPIFDAVMHLHSKDIIHRDISPDNIMISPSGTPTLLDLGAARMVLAGSSEVLTTMLKPGYAPIEQYDDDGSMQQGPWTDVYGLGALIYFLVMGNSPKQSIYRIIRDSLEPIPVNAESGYTQQFADAVMRALTLQPGQRTQNVAALIADLGWTWQLTQTVLPIITQTLPPQPAAVVASATVVAPITARVMTEPLSAQNDARLHDPEATVFWQADAAKRLTSIEPEIVPLSATVMSSSSVTLLRRAGIKLGPRKPTIHKQSKKIPTNAKRNQSPWQTRSVAATGILFAVAAAGFLFFSKDSSTANVAATSLPGAPSVAVLTPSLQPSAATTAVISPRLVPLADANPQFSASVSVIPGTVKPPETIAETQKNRVLETLVTRDPNADRNEAIQRFERSQREGTDAGVKTKSSDAALVVAKEKAVSVESLAALAQKAQREGNLQQARTYWEQLAALKTASPRSRAKALSSAATRLCATGNIDSCEQLFVQAFRADASWRLASAEAEQPQLSGAYRAARAKAWGY